MLAEVVRDALPEAIKDDSESTADGGLASLTKETLQQAARTVRCPCEGNSRTRSL